MSGENRRRGWAFRTIVLIILGSGLKSNLLNKFNPRRPSKTKNLLPKGGSGGVGEWGSGRVGAFRGRFLV